MDIIVKLLIVVDSQQRWSVAHPLWLSWVSEHPTNSSWGVRRPTILVYRV